MEIKRPNLLENFKNSRNYSTNNSENKNIVGLSKTVPEVAISEQFYQIGKYNSIPETHANLWKSHISKLLNS